jgi:hypothetical protein
MPFPGLPGLALVAAAALAILPPPQSAPAPSLPVELSKDARKALDEQFDDWELVSMDATAASCVAGAGSSIAGDIDSDGQPDLAAAVRTPEGIRLVVLLSRLWGYQTFDVDAFDPSGGYLALKPRGTMFNNPGTSMRDYFRNDTLTIARCGEPAFVAYIWRGFDFGKVEITP